MCTRSHADFASMRHLQESDQPGRAGDGSGILQHDRDAALLALCNKLLKADLDLLDPEHALKPQSWHSVEGLTHGWWAARPADLPARDYKVDEVTTPACAPCPINQDLLAVSTNRGGVQLLDGSCQPCAVGWKPDCWLLRPPADVPARKTLEARFHVRRKHRVWGLGSGLGP